MSKKSKKEKTESKAPEPERRPVPKVPKEREPLRTFLTILLVLVGLGEAALLGYVGLCARDGIQARRNYEAQLASTPSETVPSTGAGSYAGPWLMIENGVVTWEWEGGRPAGLQQPAQQLPEASNQDSEKRLSNIFALMWSYELAQSPNAAAPENSQQANGQQGENQPASSPL